MRAAAARSRALSGIWGQLDKTLRTPGPSTMPGGPSRRIEIRNFDFMDLEGSSRRTCRVAFDIGLAHYDSPPPPIL